MRLLVTGGCGYIGTVLTECLLLDGHQVTVVDTQWFGNHLAEHPDLVVLEQDIRDSRTIPLDGVDAVFVTHDHIDHIGGAIYAVEAGLPIYATAQTAKALPPAARVNLLPEHKAVLDTTRQLEREGFEVTYLEPGEDGLITPAMVEAVPGIAVLRDPTRGGLAATLNEIARTANVGMMLDEAMIPMKPDVAAACELLSSLGYGRLYNLSGGMGAWTGPVEVPTPA